jgi:hypothetical protein
MPDALSPGITVPRELFGGAVFSAELKVSLVVRPDGSPLLRFGAARLSSALCLDPRTGVVVDVWDEASPVVRSTRPAWTEGFVNSDIACFVDVARAVSGRFPYYSRSDFETDEGVAHVDRVCQELVEMVRGIDPPAAIPDRFWSTFADDVRIGDFATGDL